MAKTLQPTTTNTTTNGFNLSPAPVTNSTTFGQNVGQLTAPPSIWEQLTKNLPNFSALTSTGTGDILNQLKGILSPETQSNIGNYAASRGVDLGQPNSPISNLIGMNVTGTTTEGLQNQGLQNLNNIFSTTGSLQQNPALLSNIQETNAVNAAAPDPTKAANEMLALYQKYMNPSGATAGAGTGGFTFTPSANPYAQFQQFQQQANQPQFGATLPGQGGYANPFQVFS